MKLTITLKDPDGVYEAIDDAAKTSLEGTTAATALDKDEIEGLVEKRAAKLGEQCKKWIQYGEYVTIEIDTDAGTARVCEVKGS